MTRDDIILEYTNRIDIYMVRAIGIRRYRILRKRYHDYEEAKASATYAVVHATRCTAYTGTKLEGYIVGTIRNTLNNPDGKECTLPDDPIEETVQAPAINDDIRQDARAMLERAPPLIRKLLLLRYWQDMDCTEIAQVVGMTPARVRGLIRRWQEGEKRRYDEQTME